jgi:hypothetical protein
VVAALMAWELTVNKAIEKGKGSFSNVDIQ